MIDKSNELEDAMNIWQYESRRVTMLNHEELLLCMMRQHFHTLAQLHTGIDMFFVDAGNNRVFFTVDEKDGANGVCVSYYYDMRIEGAFEDVCMEIFTLAKTDGLHMVFAGEDDAFYDLFVSNKTTEYVLSTMLNSFS